jgi:ribosomal subunit interface protein
MENSMHKRIAFRGMEQSPVLEEFAQKHLEKLEKLLSTEPTPVFVDLVLEAHHTHHHHKVELRVITPHYDLIAHHEGPEMYQEVERVTDKMVQEIRRAKERFTTEQRKKDTYKGA